MAKRGQKPKPIAIRKLEGNRGHRPIPEEPEYTERTTCPAYLSPMAKSEWRRVHPDLVSKGIVKQKDRAVLAAYCEAVSDYRQAILDIRHHEKKHKSRYYATTSGVIKPIPQMYAKKEALAEIIKTAVELGMTPSAGARVAADNQVAPKSAMSEFLTGGEIKPYNEEDHTN